MTILFFDEFDDHNMPKNFKSEFLFDELIFVNSSDVDVLEAIKNNLQKYLSEGVYSYKMKEFSQIIGWNINSTINIYPIEQTGSK